MRIKICGLFRDEDIDYVNEGRPDYIGFVFAKSKRQVSAVLAQYLRFRLADSIIPVGVFIDAPVKEVAELYHKGIFSIAQLHGHEDEAYIARLKQITDTGTSKPIQIIKAIKLSAKDAKSLCNIYNSSKADYLLFDSGAGSGKTFNWEILEQIKIEKPWFFAGGINLKNIEQAMLLQPFALDVSSGVETSSPSEPDGIKDRKKILQLISTVRQTGIRQNNKFEFNYSVSLEQNRKILSWSIQ